MRLLAAADDTRRDLVSKTKQHRRFTLAYINDALLLYQKCVCIWAYVCACICVCVWYGATMHTCAACDDTSEEEKQQHRFFQSLLHKLLSSRCPTINYQRSEM